MTTASNQYLPLSADAYASLSSMEGTYEPIVEIKTLKLSPDAFVSYSSMEGLADASPVAAAAPAPAGPIAPPVAAPAAHHWPGYLAAALAAGAAYLVCYLPVAPFTVEGTTRHPISAAMIAIVVGVLARNVAPLPATLSAGCKRIVKRIIPIAIVLTGAGLNLALLASVGVSALLITLVCIALAVGGGYYFGRWFGLGPRTSLLLGAGTGICGTSAIVAVAPLVEAEDDDMVLSIGAVNLFGLVAMLTLPLFAQWMRLSSEAFGIWCGTSIHAVPQVVAAGFATNDIAAGTLATLVKLVRVALLAPLVFVLALVYARRHAAQGSEASQIVVHYTRLVPWFVWGFLALATVNTLGLLPTVQFTPASFLHSDAIVIDVAAATKTTAKILLALAMAAIGLEINLRHLINVGAQAITAGFACSTLLALASLALIALLIP